MPIGGVIQNEVRRGLRKTKGRSRAARRDRPSVVFETATFGGVVQPIAEGDRLVLFSDGMYETLKADEAVGTYGEFVQDLARLEILSLRPEERLRRAQEGLGLALLEDDFSLVELRFQ